MKIKVIKYQQKFAQLPDLLYLCVQKNTQHNTTQHNTTQHNTTQHNHII